MISMETRAIALPSLADVAIWLADRDQKKWLRRYALEELLSLLQLYARHTYVHLGKHGIEGVVCARSCEFGVVHIALIVTMTEDAFVALVDKLKQLHPNATCVTVRRRGKFITIPLSTVNRLLNRK